MLLVPYSDAKQTVNNNGYICYQSLSYRWHIYPANFAGYPCVLFCISTVITSNNAGCFFCVHFLTPHCATKSSLRISKIRTNTRPLCPISGRTTGSDKPKNSGFQRCPPELQQGEGRGHLQPQWSHLEQIFIKSGGNEKL